MTNLELLQIATEDSNNMFGHTLEALVENNWYFIQNGKISKLNSEAIICFNLKNDNRINLNFTHEGDKFIGQVAYFHIEFNDKTKLYDMKVRIQAYNLTKAQREIVNVTVDKALNTFGMSILAIPEFPEAVKFYNSEVQKYIHCLINKFIMERITLSKHQIEFLQQKGFTRDETKHSGFQFIEQDEPLATYIFIPGYESDVNTKHAYKFEILELNFFEESVMEKQYISKDQSFEDFINFWID